MARLLPEIAVSFLWLTPAGSGSLKPPRRSPGADAKMETETVNRSAEL